MRQFGSPSLTLKVPMPKEPSFDDLMARLRAGDQDAATELFGRFAQR